MRRLNHLVIVGALVSIALAMIPLKSACAADPGISSTSSSDDPPSAKSKKVSDYRHLLDEIDAERKHIEKLESAVRELQYSNQQLQQTQTTLQTSLQTTNSQTAKQVSQIQKTLNSELGPFNFGDKINSFFGQHTFSIVGGIAAGFAYSRQSGQNQFTLDFEVNPIIRLNDWLLFYSSVGARAGTGGVANLGPSLANLQMFPFGWKVPVELVLGIFDTPFGDWYENQSPNWVNPFITPPLLYGAEAIEPGSSLGIAARGAIQWGQMGQDVDYTVWADSGPTFESAQGVNLIPNPVIGEIVNPLTGTNLSTNGKGVGARFRLFPIPVRAELGRLELMATTYNGKWLNNNWFHAWGVGYAYRLGPFRSRGEWAQTYRQMPSLPAAAIYPGCCGHENRQGWYALFGYFLYGIPHPDLGFFEQRFDKIEALVRYSGVNQRAIVTNDISTQPVFGFSGSPAIFNPHAREVALGIDYWFAPSIVWQTEIDWELPHQGGTAYTFNGSATTPVAHSVGATTNDTAVLTQFVVGF